MFCKNNKKINKKGLTLTELIVSTVMISIVVLGVGAFTATMSKLQDSTSKQSIVASQVTAAMIQIKKDAASAVGDASNPGIDYDDDGDTRSICFRHDVSDALDYSDDEWVCYWHDSSNILWRCDPVVGTYDPNCSSSRTQHLALSDGDFFQYVTDADNKLKYIKITLSSSFDTSKTSTSHLTNPEYTLTTQVNPTAHSR